MSDEFAEPKENTEVPQQPAPIAPKIPLRTQIGMVLGRAIAPNGLNKTNRYEEAMRDAEKMGQFGQKQIIAVFGVILRKLDELEPTE